MRLTVVGSSDAFNSAGRAHSCYLLEAAGCGTVIVDFGATAHMALKKLGRAVDDLDGMLFTHLHGDHIGGVPFLVIDGMFNQIRSRDLPILGPKLTESKLEEFLAAAYGDILDREKPYTISVDELQPEQSVDWLGWKVSAFAAEHMDPPHVPLCLRVEAPDGKTVAFSGDTCMCPGLWAAARDADLFVAECTDLQPPAGRHCTWSEWETELPNLTCRHVLFTHLGERVRAAVDSLQAPEGSPPHSFADDGMVFEL